MSSLNCAHDFAREQRGVTMATQEKYPETDRINKLHSPNVREIINLFCNGTALGTTVS